ncbi:uncharacterized protein LOC122319718 isoform X2 [Drosophila ficusphila]|uniref:uncharacterized protein LOC122319718 isoform X2 n=1 Tax=Drosophila ficusphila TaxID=30025 RepID=UPI001C8996C4|nr:uncharacterized protein LOC122319718 isoform X2 [Drosophila ficusphila]
MRRGADPDLARPGRPICPAVDPPLSLPPRRGSPLWLVVRIWPWTPRDSGWLQGTHAARRTHSVYVAGPPSDGRPLLPRYPAAPRPVAYHRLAVSALPQPACLSADRPPPPVFAGPDAAAAGLLLFIYFFM